MLPLVLRCPAPLAARGLSLQVETVEHLPFLRKLHAWHRWADLSLLPWDDQQKEAFLDSQFDMQHRHYATSYANAQFLVLCEDETVIGRISVAEDETALRLLDILLHPQRRGLGIGGALIGALQEQADGRAAAVVLHVDKANPAQKLYQRLGFRLVGDAGAAWCMEYGSESEAKGRSFAHSKHTTAGIAISPQCVTLRQEYRSLL